MNNHSEDELLSAYLDGEVTATERMRVETLLANHSDAQQSLEELRTVRAGLALLPRYTLPADFVELVLARIRKLDGQGSSGAANETPRTISLNGAERRGRPPFHRALRYVAYTAVAAAAAIAVIVVTAKPRQAEGPVATVAGKGKAGAPATARPTLQPAPLEAPAPAAPADEMDAHGIADMPAGRGRGGDRSERRELAKTGAESNGVLLEGAEKLGGGDFARKKAAATDDAGTAPATTAPAAGPAAAARAPHESRRLAGSGGGGHSLKKAEKDQESVPTLSKDSNGPVDKLSEEFSKLATRADGVATAAAGAVQIRQVECEVSADALQKGELVSLFSRQNVALSDEPVTEDLLTEGVAKESDLEKFNYQTRLLTRGNVARKGMGDVGQPGEVHLVTAVMDEPQYKTLLKELSRYPGFRVGTNYQLGYQFGNEAGAKNAPAFAGGAGLGLGDAKQLNQQQEAIQRGANVSAPRSGEPEQTRSAQEFGRARLYFSQSGLDNRAGLQQQAYRFRAPDEPTAQRLANVLLNQGASASASDSDIAANAASAEKKDKSKVVQDERRDLGAAVAAQKPKNQAQRASGKEKEKVQVLFVFRVVDPRLLKEQSPAASVRSTQ